MQKRRYVVWFSNVIFIFLNYCFIECGAINEQVNTDTPFLMPQQLDFDTLHKEPVFLTSTPAKNVQNTSACSRIDAHEGEVTSPRKGNKVKPDLFEKVLRKNHEQQHKDDNPLYNEDSEVFYDTLNYSFSEFQFEAEGMFCTTSILSDITEENTSDFSRVETATESECESKIHDSSLNGFKVDENQVKSQKYDESLNELSASLSSYSPDTSYSCSKDSSFSENEISKDVDDDYSTANKEKLILSKVPELEWIQENSNFVENPAFSFPECNENVDKADCIDIESESLEEHLPPLMNKMIRKNKIKYIKTKDKERNTHYTAIPRIPREVLLSNPEFPSTPSAKTKLVVFKKEALNLTTGSNDDAKSDESIADEETSDNIKLNIDINHNYDDLNRNASGSSKDFVICNPSDGDICIQSSGDSFKDSEHKDFSSIPDNNFQDSIRQETDAFDNHPIAVNSPMPIPNFSLHSERSKCSEDRFFDSLGIESFSESLLRAKYNEISADECTGGDDLDECLNSKEYEDGYDMFSKPGMNASLKSLEKFDKLSPVDGSARDRFFPEECSVSKFGKSEINVSLANLNDLHVQNFSVENMPGLIETFDDLNVSDDIILPMATNIYENSGSACLTENEELNLCDPNENHLCRHTNSTLHQEKHAFEQELSNEEMLRINLNSYLLNPVNSNAPINTGLSHEFEVPASLLSNIPLREESLRIHENEAEGFLPSGYSSEYKNPVFNDSEDGNDRVNSTACNHVSSSNETVEDSHSIQVQSQANISTENNTFNESPNNAPFENMFVSSSYNNQNRVEDVGFDSNTRDMITQNRINQDEVSLHQNTDSRSSEIPQPIERDLPPPLVKSRPNKPNIFPKNINIPHKQRSRILAAIAIIISVGSLSGSILYLLYLF